MRVLSAMLAITAACPAQQTHPEGVATAHAIRLLCDSISTTPIGPTWFTLAQPARPGGLLEFRWDDTPFLPGCPVADVAAVMVGPYFTRRMGIHLPGNMPPGCSPSVVIGAIPVMLPMFPFCGGNLTMPGLLIPSDPNIVGQSLYAQTLIFGNGGTALTMVIQFTVVP